MPASPLLSEPLELAAVELPRTAGRVLARSAMFAGATVWISLLLITLTGVGAL